MKQKTKKKTKLTEKQREAIRALDNPQVAEPTFKNLREKVEYRFITKVLKQKYPLVITDKTTLEDIAKKDPQYNGAFLDYFLDLYVDGTIVEFRASIIKKKRLPIKEIIDYLEKSERGKIIYGDKFANK